LAELPGPAIPKHSSSSRKLVRGSTLLLAGRLVAKFGNFFTQILIVRYLTKGDYGAFTYALSIVGFVQAVVTLGLDRSITRFLPIYHERGDHRRLFGTLAMAVTVIASLSVLAVLALFAGSSLVQERIKDPVALTLLYLLIFLAPLQALDDLLIGVFAVFAKPRAIFFRRHVLAPTLKFLVVLALVLTRSDVIYLAIGYVLATLIGLAIYGFQLIGVFREQGLTDGDAIRRPEWPWGEVFSFTFPLLTTELVYLSMNTVNVVLLEHFRSTTEVASLQAVLPTAKMNEMVMASFATLFTPMAARLFAKQDSEGINALYWRTAIWIAVFSMPLFLLTFSLAKPITVLLYGARYESAAPILALLSFGYYFNAALGFNGLTLKVFGKIRYTVTINVITALASVGFSLALIPAYGALGAGIAMMLTMVTHNLLKQAGLRLGTGVHLFEWKYLRVYLSIAVVSALLWAIPGTGIVTIVASVVLAAVASMALVRLNANLLDLHVMFPEVLKMPAIRWLLGQPRRPASLEARDG
jgi:O-antigen/teichoic acid export membrane protein